MPVCRTCDCRFVKLKREIDEIGGMAELDKWVALSRRLTAGCQAAS
jgi:hypothetical protein